ncbi:hypothetical protein BC940DRAFT_290781 [Gongronella butleri]|nr:hypothetical protein BC940DRAFT_290781 [Gongronella butleri]
MTAKTLIVESEKHELTPTIGEFFKDQEDLDFEAETSSLDSAQQPIKFVRHDSVRMIRQTLQLAKPSAAIIETVAHPHPMMPVTPPPNHDQHHLHPPPPSPPHLHHLAKDEKHQLDTQRRVSSSHSSRSSVDVPCVAAAAPSSPSSQHHPQSQSHQQHNQHRVPPTPHQNPQVDPVEAMVQAGIQCHESGQLEKATECFRQAAAKDSPMGMFLYGVSLRHGWGCKKSEHLAFQYLQKAAEHAVLDLNSLSNTVNRSATKGELIIAIYEMGVSFRHGWGCKKNKETAVHFFKIAADLGDPDAQNDLGFCYHHGHGVKKDLHLAAKYYRLADKQGHGLLGNSWIYKAKYLEKH